MSETDLQQLRDALRLQSPDASERKSVADCGDSDPSMGSQPTIALDAVQEQQGRPFASS